MLLEAAAAAAAGLQIKWQSILLFGMMLRSLMMDLASDLTGGCGLAMSRAGVRAIEGVLAACARVTNLGDADLTLLERKEKSPRTLTPALLE